MNRLSFRCALLMNYKRITNQLEMPILNSEKQKKGLRMKNSIYAHPNGNWFLFSIFFSIRNMIKLHVKLNCRRCFLTLLQHFSWSDTNPMFLFNFNQFFNLYITDKARSIFMDSAAAELGSLKWTKYVNGNTNLVHSHNINSLVSNPQAKRMKAV